MSTTYDPNYTPGKPQLIEDPATGKFCIMVDSVDVTGPLDPVGDRKRIYEEAWAEKRAADT